MDIARRRGPTRTTCKAPFGRSVFLPKPGSASSVVRSASVPCERSSGCVGATLLTVGPRCPASASSCEGEHGSGLVSCLSGDIKQTS
jgi:hypothetical protein